MIKTEYSICLRQFISYWHIKILNYKSCLYLFFKFIAAEPTLFKPAPKKRKPDKKYLNQKIHQYSPICQHLSYNNR